MRTPSRSRALRRSESAEADPDPDATPGVRPGDGPADRILDAARDLLFEAGVAGLTTDRLARRAGVSKTSIYKHFAEPNLLLDAVVDREASKISYGVPQEPDSASAFWASLKSYGANLLDLLNRPEVIRLDQLMHEQARARPGLGRRFFDATYGRSLRELESMLRFGARRGFIRQDLHPRRDAELLLSMWEGFAFGQARLGLLERPFPRPQAWAAACVDRLYPADVW